MEGSETIPAAGVGLVGTAAEADQTLSTQRSPSPATLEATGEAACPEGWGGGQGTGSQVPSPSGTLPTGPALTHHWGHRARAASTGQGLPSPAWLILMQTIMMIFDFKNEKSETG